MPSQAHAILTNTCIMGNIAGELEVLENNMDMLFDMQYWTMMTITGLFGFLIGIITVYQITLTSPLTHNIAGTAKATVQTLLALMIYRNPVTWKGGMGILLVLFGSAFYTAVRNQEMNYQRQQQKLQQQSIK
jgi:GDP-fucose transporter C1